jgi:fructose-1,6-bisphosphatase/inositol monophosphatase family enzyme
MSCQCKQQDYLQQAISIAKSAGAIVKAAFNTPNKKVDFKSSKNDLVTETDRQSESLIFSQLKASFPSHRYITDACISCSYIDSSGRRVQHRM